MFPLHPNNELYFQISSNNPPQQDLILDQHNLLQFYHATENIADNSSGKNRRRGFTSKNNDATDKDYSEDKKKLMHRDIERQRRQEMTALYASLRSLLPLEYIKGKRSIADHIYEAVSYIKHLRRRIEELDGKRDWLKQQMNFRANNDSSESGNSSNTGLIIRPCLGGIELVFSSGLKNGQGLTLTRALYLLLNDGIPVVNCVSTRVNERVFHTVQAEMEDPSCLNLYELQQRFTRSNSSFSQ